MFTNSEMLLATSVVVPSINVLASRWVSLQSSPWPLAMHTLIFLMRPIGHRRVFRGACTARRAISTVASYAKLPLLNHRLASSLTKSRTNDELRNLAIVSLTATETFRFVRVLCSSRVENLLMTKTSSPLTMITATDARIETV